MTPKRLTLTVAAILAVYLVAMIGLGARAAAPPKVDRFRSRLSGNVVTIPARCWQEDSLAHLYMADYDGARLTLHCHHRGY